MASAYKNTYRTIILIEHMQEKSCWRMLKIYPYLGQKLPRNQFSIFQAINGSNGFDTICVDNKSYFSSTVKQLLSHKINEFGG